MSMILGVEWCDVCYCFCLLTFRLPEIRYIGSIHDMNFVCYSWYMIKETSLGAFEGRCDTSNFGRLKVNKSQRIRYFLKY